MITIIAAIAIASEVNAPLAPSGTQTNPQSLLQQIVPQPTGRNGYEEYLMACDVVRAANLGQLVDATPETLNITIQQFEATLPKGATKEEVEKFEDEKPSLAQYEFARKYRNYTVIQLRKEALSRAGRALDLVRRGNQKPVFDPRVTVEASTLFPEYSPMRAVGRLAVAGAYVAFAEGNSKQGTEYLCDSIILGQNLTDGVLIARLVGISMQAIAFAAFEKFLPAMSLTDALMVENLAPRLIINPPAAVRSLIKEFDYISRTVGKMFDQKEGIQEFTGMSETKSEADTSAEKFIARMTPAEQRQVVDLCQRKLARHRETVLAAYRRPESTWDEMPEDDDLDIRETQTVNSVNDLADYLSNSVTPVFSQLGSAEIKNRTQIRLLALAGSVIKYRWEHDRWPAKLEDAVGRNGIVDPASNDEFQFEVQGSGFRVYSKGSRTTGEIALRYRRQSTGDNQPPPP